MRKRQVMTLIGIVLLCTMGTAFAEGSSSSDASAGSTDISAELKDIQSRIDMLDAKYKALETQKEQLDKKNDELNKKTDELNKKSKEQDSKNEYDLKFSGVGWLREEYQYDAKKRDQVLPGATMPASSWNGGTNWFGNPNDNPDTWSRLLLFLDKKLTPDSSFHAAFGGDSLSTHPNAPTQFYMGYYAHQEPGYEWAVGRFMDAPWTELLAGVGPWADGGRIVWGNNKNTSLHIVKNGPINEVTIETHGSLSKDFQLGGGFAYDRENQAQEPALCYLPAPTPGTTPWQNQYKQVAVKAVYTGITNLTLDARFSVNYGDAAKYEASIFGGGTPTAFAARAKYKGAIPTVVGSSGAWVEYRNASFGFDTVGFVGGMNMWLPYAYTFQGLGGAITNMRGFEYGVETVLAPMTIFQVRLGVMTPQHVYTGAGLASPTLAIWDPNYATSTNEKYLIANLTYLF